MPVDASEYGMYFEGTDYGYKGTNQWCETGWAPKFAVAVHDAIEAEGAVGHLPLWQQAMALERIRLLKSGYANDVLDVADIELTEGAFVPDVPPGAIAVQDENGNYHILMPSV